jgi:tricorn protease
MVNFAGQEVLLTIEPQANPKEPRFVSVPTLPSERRVRYREWVRSNELRVQEATAGRVGYVHLPDMGTEGISEFHRGYLAQVDRHALIIDVRYNAGGMVSPLILEKLMHRHLGYDVPRWGSPESYPYHTIRGPLLALANSFTGSDGDMFSASFRALQLGSLVGKRTWGGVIGIDSRYTLVDGTVTTQPQYSIWFHHLGWTVENYGVDPDLEVEDPPQAYARGEDPQLERAIQEILRTLEEVDLPPAQFGPIPRRPLP